MTVEYPLDHPYRVDFDMTPQERMNLLKWYGELYHLNNFVETGTHLGNTTMFLQPYFERLFTIELDSGLYARAKDRFQTYSNIDVWHGDSGAGALLSIMYLLSGPSLFWLDGHYSGPGSARGPKSSPIVEELKVVLNHKFRHVILIDDARIFEGGPEHHLEEHYRDYPSLDWVKATAESHNFQFILADDIMRLIPME